MTEIDLPQYVKLFGNVDFREGDSARSVYSPAAYLVDLLQLKDDKKAGIEIDPTTSLEQRRKDIISSLLLNKENTFDLLPYLDIVNEVLESKIEASTQEDAYDVLKNAHFHLDLPFNLQHERIQLYLEALGIAPEQLHKAFARKVNYDFIASEFLGLSNESVNIITQSTRGEALAACYGQHLPLPGWIPVSLFLETTGLSRAELKELLFAALDEKEILDQRQSDLFYNQGLDGFATYNDSEREIIWSSGNYYEEGGAIPEAWYDRIHRLIRLAKKTGLSITDAEHVVRNCCDYQLNKESLKIIASIKYIAHNFDIPIDEASALLGPLTYLGRGNSER
ncbi:MAG: Tc toxin subunit A, partial [Gammaproteobacteria bacterium]|nr:Tc toxin subunit A [Gammaproteobacteria bacterium]